MLLSLILYPHHFFNLTNRLPRPNIANMPALTAKLKPLLPCCFPLPILNRDPIIGPPASLPLISNTATNVNNLALYALSTSVVASACKPGSSPSPKPQMTSPKMSCQLREACQRMAKPSAATKREARMVLRSRALLWFREAVMGEESAVGGDWELPSRVRRRYRRRCRWIKYVEMSGRMIIVTVLDPVA